MRTPYLLTMLAIVIFLAGCAGCSSVSRPASSEDQVPLHCRNQTDRKDACIFDHAKELLDSSFCAMITQDKIKDSCFLIVAVQSEDEQVCQNISELMKKESCLSSFAQTQRDENKCSLLQTGNIRNECLEKVAIEKADASICRMIGRGAFFDRCVSRTRTNRPWLCFEIESQEYLLECLGRDYFEDNNNTACEDIVSGDLKEKCFQRFDEFS
jgi:hypothetical protein